MKRIQKKVFRKPRGFVPNPADFWGFSVKSGRIGYAEVRRQLPNAMFRRIKKRRPMFVYEWIDNETGFRMEVETSLNPKNGLLFLGAGNPVFVVRHYDLNAVAAATASQPDEAGSADTETDGEIVEWRKYIDEDGSFLLELRREVGKAFRLHESRPECCNGHTVYVRHQGFTCPACKTTYAVPDAYDFKEVGEKESLSAAAV